VFSDELRGLGPDGIATRVAQTVKVWQVML
jgi:hypothetical protein